MPIRRYLTLATLSVLLVGCQVSDYTLAKRSEIDGKIAAARVETQAKLDTLHTAEVKNLKDTIATHEAREQGAADHLVKGLIVAGSTKPDDPRPQVVMGQSVKETAAQLPPATPTAQLKAMEDLQRELDTAKVSNEQLRAQYEGQLAQAREQGAAQVKAISDLTTSLQQIDADKARVLDEARKTEATLSDARKKADDEALAKSNEAKAAAERTEKLKAWLMGVLLVGAAAAGVGAAFIPIPSLKSKLIIAAAVCGGAAVAIPFIQPWFVMAAVGGLLVLAAGWAILDYKREHGDATDTYRALNEAKAKLGGDWAKVAEVLKEWHTDPNTPKRIEDRLKQVGDV